MLVCMKEANGVIKKRLVFVTITFCILITTCFISCFSATANTKEIKAPSDDFKHKLIIKTYAYSFSEGKNVPTRSSMVVISKKYSLVPEREVKILCGSTVTFEPVYPGETYSIFVVKMPCLFGSQFYKIPEQHTTQIINEHTTRINLNTMFGVMPSL